MAKEQEFWALTDFGKQRVQTVTFMSIPPMQRIIAKTLYDLGGAAEMDELAMRTNTPQPMLRSALQSMVKSGYVQPAGVPSQMQMGQSPTYMAGQ